MRLQIEMDGDREAYRLIMQNGLLPYILCPIAGYDVTLKVPDTKLDTIREELDAHGCQICLILPNEGHTPDYKVFLYKVSLHLDEDDAMETAAVHSSPLLVDKSELVFLVDSEEKENV